MEIQIKELKITDVDDYLAGRLRDLMKEFFPDGLPRELNQDKLREVLSQPNVYIIGVYSGEQLIGICLVYLVETISRRLMVLEEVVVDPDFRQKGVGTALTRMVDEKAKELGVSCVELNVEQKNAIAQQFYRNSGFHDRKELAFRKWFKTQGKRD